MWRLPTWIIVLIGLLFNISAALITHFTIDSKTNQLNVSAMQIMANHKEMDLFWLQIEGVERKREALYLLHNQGPLSENIARSFSRLMAAYLTQELSPNELNNLEAMDLLINEYQDQIREKIDNKFFLNLGLAELEVQLRQQISTLRNWSIFLQMIGLSLILARDLSRKP